MSVPINPILSYDIAPYTQTISANMPPSYNPINSSYFSYIPGQNNYAYYYNKNGAYIGQMTQPQCEKQCLIDDQCSGYSLVFPNNPISSDIGKYRCNLTKNSNMLLNIYKSLPVKISCYDQLTHLFLHRVGCHALS
jgi:hypothetical protein